jgi:outer membrane protein insertion porin family
MHMRISLNLGLLVLLVACLAFPAASLAKAKDGGDGAVMVLPFQINGDSKFEYLHTKLPQLLIERLREAGLKVLSEAEVLSLINKKKVGHLDMNVVKELAAQGRARYAVYGSFTAAGQAVSLDARIVDASGQQQTKSVFVTKDGAANVAPAVEELAKKIKNALIVSDVVSEIEVRGTKNLDKDVVLNKLKVQRGDPYDPTQVNEDIKNIFELGFFEDVKISVEDVTGGKRLIVEVVEKPRIMAIGVIGAGDVGEDDVREAMSTKTGSVLNPKVLAEDLGKIRELYRKKGFPLAKVTYKLENTETGQARLNILVEQATKQYIRGIKVTGNQAFSEGTLKDEMALSERSIISWITGSGVLQEEMLDRDAAVVEEYYANHGYIDCKVGKPQVDYKDDGIHITYTVVEGQPYKVNSVSFKGDLLVDEAKLIELTQMPKLAKSHDYFNRSTLRSDTQKLSGFYNDQGYAFAEADVDLRRGEGQTVDITYVIKKNQKVYVRQVTVEGNDRTRDNVIRRELAINDGDQFSGSRLKLSTERLTKLDIFESADIETVPTADPNEVDLKVKVKEKSTGQLAGGVGYSSYVGAYIGIKLQEKNLFGKGYVVNLSAQFSGVDTQYLGSFTNPSLYDSKFAGGVDLYWTTYEYPDFTKDTVGGIMRFSYPVGDYTRIYWGYRLDQYRIYDVYSGASSDITDYLGYNWSSVLIASIVRDTTNRTINPSRGSKNSLSAENGGNFLGGTDNYIKTVADTSWYYELPWFKEHILHLHGQAGATFKNSDDEVPVFENFYLGGMNSIRGYETRYISPRDKATGDYIGGTREAFINIEYIFPLHSKVGLVGVAFFDAGDTWRGGIGDMDIKKSVGAGVRWFSPMGPLRLEYGYGMDKIDNQNGQSKLEFSIGQFF